MSRIPKVRRISYRTRACACARCSANTKGPTPSRSTLHYYFITSSHVERIITQGGGWRVGEVRGGGARGRERKKKKAPHERVKQHYSEGLRGGKETGSLLLPSRHKKCISSDANQYTSRHPPTPASTFQCDRVRRRKKEERKRKGGERRGGDES